ncbi:MAG: cell division protein ZapA [Stagnimonas sp.]|nr:cell division protein ZapA [Stagnimonas sp.]
MKTTPQADLMTVTVKIMAREYAVQCAPAEHEALVASAEFLNERMSAIKKRGRALGAEKIAVMAALNLARELLTLRGDASVVVPDGQAIERLKQFSRDIDTTLSDVD